MAHASYIQALDIIVDLKEKQSNLDSIITEANNIYYELSSFFNQNENEVISQRFNEVIGHMESYRPYISILIITSIFFCVCTVLILKIFITNPITKISYIIENFRAQNTNLKLPHTRIYEIHLINKLMTSLISDVKIAKHIQDNLKLKYNDLLVKSHHDPLTHVRNRRSLNIIMNDTAKADPDLAILMCDIDFFKKCNDTMVHQKGDEILVEIANCLKNNIDKGDNVYRYGGEEFCIVLKDVTIDEIEAICDRLNKAVVALSIINEGNDNKPVSISIGASFQLFDTDTFADIVKRADMALYEAKNKGRNTYEIYRV